MIELLSHVTLIGACLQAANGFLFVVSCDTGRVLYVADSIFPVLNMTQVRLTQTEGGEGRWKREILRWILERLARSKHVRLDSPR